MLPSLFSNTIVKIILPPGEKGIYPDVGGDDDEQREEEDLAVVGRVVDIRPVVRAAVYFNLN